MREVDVKLITDLVSEMCMEANYQLSSDMRQALSDAQTNEKSELGKNILAQLQKNLLIAQQDSIPICQDTGMAVLFLKIGQEVHFNGGSLTDAINEGVRR